ncbi:helix-turn-helix transcriptional regulator [Luteimonas sp. RD2P54]|uniref:Helix-turn-helix transcriptional regulator n=1 Tax=Luteimonas endophytica TaxID=3042023 RepID=A0ABT6JCW4_9GAMM|nr:helix-turn-helix transcriptional regulator [Luteimonas endophytica]MDH5824666.1 helix-turn-helix transcriptional regulator [Luteimonas endophytica]
MLSPARHRALCHARRRLQDTDPQAGTVAEIAAEAGLSQYQFIRGFAAVFGETPHHLRQRHRLERAREMLLLGSLPVTEICLAVGFSSLGSFSSLFRRRFGVSPSRLRGLASGGDPARHQPGCLTLMARAWQPPQQFRRSGPATAR